MVLFFVSIAWQYLSHGVSRKSRYFAPVSDTFFSTERILLLRLQKERNSEVVVEAWVSSLLGRAIFFSL